MSPASKETKEPEVKSMEDVLLSFRGQTADPPGNCPISPTKVLLKKNVPFSKGGIMLVSGRVFSKLMLV